MGSRIMHYCLSNLLSQQLQIDNHAEFLLGGIAPDVHPYMQLRQQQAGQLISPPLQTLQPQQSQPLEPKPVKPKDITHFVDRDANGKGQINYLRFYEANEARMNEPFYLGYLCHLISDSEWTNDTYLKVVQRFTPEENELRQRFIYRDFSRLNGRIIRQYSLKLNAHTIPSRLGFEVYSLEDYMPDLLEGLRKDFACDEQTAAEQLELFLNDNSEIIDYMDASVNRCLQFLKQYRLLAG
jgi:hypothetical protein